MCEWFAGSAEKDHFQGLKGAAHAGADPVELSAKFALNNTLRKGASRQHSQQGLEQRSQQSNARDYGDALNVRKLSSQEGGSESLCARTSRPGRSRCP
jgi:hypothetical protein